LFLIKRNGGSINFQLKKKEFINKGEKLSKYINL
jgi:hypothetical protein